MVSDLGDRNADVHRWSNAFIEFTKERWRPIVRWFLARDCAEWKYPRTVGD